MLHSLRICLLNTKFAKEKNNKQRFKHFKNIGDRMKETIECSANTFNHNFKGN